MARILVVEDDDAIRQLVHKVLAMNGHDVDEAASGDEAIRKLTEERYQLVVLDLMLGAVSGWEALTEAVRDTLQRSPEQLAMRRKEELEKAELLYRLESAFQRW
jgi:DNA-binding response OmpR family regulator